MPPKADIKGAWQKSLLLTLSGHPYIGVSCYLEDSQGAAQAVVLAKETGTRLRPQRPGCPFFKRSKKWQTSRVTGHLFLLFFFLFSFFLWITQGLFLLFPLAFVFFSLITHICFSLFESGFPRWFLKLCPMIAEDGTYRLPLQTLNRQFCSNLDQLLPQRG